MCINVYSWIFVCIFFSYICIVTRYVCTVACIFCAKCHISFTVNNLHFFEMNPRNVYRKRNMIFEFSVLQKSVFLIHRHFTVFDNEVISYCFTGDCYFILRYDCKNYLYLSSLLIHFKIDRCRWWKLQHFINDSFQD